MKETRDRGILNKRERNYFRRRGTDEAEIESQSPEERGIRQSIREHTRNAWLDFQILFDHLEERDREQLFPDDERTAGEYADEQSYQITGATTAAFAFLIQNDPTTAGFDAAGLSNRLEKAVKQALVTDGRSVENVTVDIDVEYGERLDELKERALTDLSDETLSQLHAAGELSQEEYFDVMASRLGKRALDDADDQD